MIHSTYLCVSKRVVFVTRQAVLARFRGRSAVSRKQPPMCVQRHGTDFRSCCADDDSNGLKEKHHQFLEKRKRQGESTREKEEETRHRASAKKNLKLIKKACQSDNRMQGNVHPEEQAAMKTHNKSLEEKKRADVILI